MLKVLRNLSILIMVTCSFVHAQSITFKGYDFTDIPQIQLQLMLENLHSIYGKNIEHKFNKNLKYEISSNPGGQAYVDPYTTKDLRLVLMVPYDAQEPEILATLCHELGHLVSKGRMLNWARLKNPVATEGQADFFVPSCMKLYMDKFSYLPDLEINPDVQKACSKNLQHDFTENECELILQSFKNIFTEYNDDISYDKTYGKKAFLTQRDHPDDQCRLDTVKDSVLGKGRNRCWFSPFFPARPKWIDFKYWRTKRSSNNT